MTNKDKARHWGIVVYPESAPENWMELIAQTHLAFAVSPIHDKDHNPDGELIKPHWHVILSWDGPQRASAAIKMAEMVGAPQPIKLESVRGAYRYFTHKDHPDKYQYDEKDIKVYNGFDISNHISFTKEEKYQAFTQIRQIIRDNNVTEYEELLDVLEKMDYNLLKVAYDNTHMLNAVLRSRRHKNRR